MTGPVVTHVPGLVLIDHQFQVPLDHADPGGAQITVFAREVADPDGRDRPFLVFLQGGPGSEAPRPSRVPLSPPWLERALADFRVLMFDQRGTGRSTPVGVPTGTPAEQAAYLALFRADSIVRDAEAVRAALQSPPWTVLGQSFGGFCTLTYLSLAPEGLRRALFTGGLPALGVAVDDIYRATYETMRDRNLRYLAQYPQDGPRISELLARDDLVLPGGDRITAGRVRQLGLALGMSDGAAGVHALLELPFDSPAFLCDFEAASPFPRSPIYAVLQEACWADGGVTNWAAERVMPADYRPEWFTAEHVYPWMYDQIGALMPLREAAHLLAAWDWPALYDVEQLAANDVPAAAIVYAEDAYVDRRFSEATAAHVRGLRKWLTNEYEHNGLRADGERILDRLLGLADGRL